MQYLSIASLRKEFPRANGFIQDSTIQLSEDPEQSYDIFLSHKYLDKDDVLRIKEKLASYNLTVFIDWELEEFEDRSKINKKVANKIVEVMKRCNTLIYSTTKNYSSSVWMPWELGVFHGLKGIDRIAILPIATSDEKYPGTEYLELYYYIDEAEGSKTSNKYLWVNASKDDNYIKLESWIKENKQPYKR